jgi:hypothetical protein
LGNFFSATKKKVNKKATVNSKEEPVKPLTPPESPRASEPEPATDPVIVTAPECTIANSGDEIMLSDWQTLLSYRFLAYPVPMELEGLSACDDSSLALARKESFGRMASNSTPKAAGDDSMAVDRSLFGTARVDDQDHRRDRRRTDRQDTAQKPALPTPSENAYKVSRDHEKLERDEEIKRKVQSLLNKICPENCEAIAIRIKNEAGVANVHELELVIALIFKKALLEMHYCETYADLVFHLKTAMPEFPSQNDKGKPVTFKSTLLTVCQDEFEAMPKKLSDQKSFAATEENQASGEELALHKQKIKQRVLANMRFIGNLFLRQLLTSKIIAAVINDLTMCQDTLPRDQDAAADAVPEEHIIECICELLGSTGFALEQMPQGKICLQQVCGRLLDLKQRKTSQGKGIYSKRIQFAIQDLLDTRQDGWKKRSFKASAKTKEEVKQEQERNIKAQAAGRHVDDAEITIAGARPACMSAEKM